MKTFIIMIYFHKANLYNYTLIIKKKINKFKEYQLDV